MTKILVAADHVGQSLVAIRVAHQLRKLGVKVTFLLDGKGPAAIAAKDPSSQVAKELSAAEIEPCFAEARGSRDRLMSMLREVDWVLVMMSPADPERGNVESTLVGLCDSARKRVAAYTEVPCGHAAPLWIQGRNGNSSLLDQLNFMFCAHATRDLQSKFGDHLLEVGPCLDRYESLDLDRVGEETRHKLGIKDDTPVVWFRGAPYRETVIVLNDVVNALYRFRKAGLQSSDSVVLVVTRHSRDKDISFLTGAYRDILKNANLSGIRVVENSADHKEQVLRSPFALSEPVPYSHMMCACRDRGAVVTLHGTDGLYAPYLKVPSILCCASDEYDPVMVREKGVRTFPVHANCPLQVGSSDDLTRGLQRFIFSSSGRQDYLRQCAIHYSVPHRHAVAVVAGRLHHLATH